MEIMGKDGRMLKRWLFRLVGVVPQADHDATVQVLAEMREEIAGLTARVDRLEIESRLSGSK